MRSVEKAREYEIRQICDSELGKYVVLTGKTASNYPITAKSGVKCIYYSSKLTHSYDKYQTAVEYFSEETDMSLVSENNYKIKVTNYVGCPLFPTLINVKSKKEPPYIGVLPNYLRTYTVDTYLPIGFQIYAYGTIQKDAGGNFILTESNENSLILCKMNKNELLYTLRDTIIASAIAGYGYAAFAAYFLRSRILKKLFARRGPPIDQ
jgi:hypothetical protein